MRIDPESGLPALVQEVDIDYYQLLYRVTLCDGEVWCIDMLDIKPYLPEGGNSNQGELAIKAIEAFLENHPWIIQFLIDGVCNSPR